MSASPSIIISNTKADTMVRIADMQKNAMYASRSSGVRIPTSISTIALLHMDRLVYVCLAISLCCAGVFISFIVCVSVMRFRLFFCRSLVF